MSKKTASQSTLPPIDKKSQTKLAEAAKQVRDEEILAEDKRDRDENKRAERDERDERNEGGEIILAMAEVVDTPEAGADRQGTSTTLGEELLKGSNLSTKETSDSEKAGDLFPKGWGMPLAIGGGLFAIAAASGGGGASAVTSTNAGVPAIAPTNDNNTFSAKLVPVAGAFLPNGTVSVIVSKRVGQDWQVVEGVVAGKVQTDGTIALVLPKDRIASTDILKITLADAGSGGDYLDEVAGSVQSLGAHPLSVVLSSLAANEQVTVNPLTDLAASKMAGNFSVDNIRAVNAAVAHAFGLTSDDLARIVPKVVTDSSFNFGSGSADAKAYGYALALISGMSKAQMDAGVAPDKAMGEAMRILDMARLENGVLNLDPIMFATVPGVAGSGTAIQVGLAAGANQLQKAAAKSDSSIAAQIGSVLVDSIQKPGAEQSLIAGADANVSYYNFVKNGGLSLRITPSPETRVGDTITLKLFRMNADGTVDSGAAPYIVKHIYTEADAAKVAQLGVGSFSLTVQALSSETFTDSSGSTAQPSDNHQLLLKTGADGAYITDGSIYSYLVVAAGNAAVLPAGGTVVAIDTSLVAIENAPPKAQNGMFNGVAGSGSIIYIDVVLPVKVNWGMSPDAVPTLMVTVTDRAGVAHALTAVLDTGVGGKSGGDTLRFKLDLTDPTLDKLEGSLSIGPNALAFQPGVLLTDIFGNTLFENDGGVWKDAGGTALTKSIGEALGMVGTLKSGFGIDAVAPLDPTLKFAADALPAGLDPVSGFAVDRLTAPHAGALNAAISPDFGDVAFKLVTNELRQALVVTFSADVAKDVGAIVNLTADVGTTIRNRQIASTRIELVDGVYQARFGLSDYDDASVKALAGAIGGLATGANVKLFAQVVDAAGNKSLRMPMTTFADVAGALDGDFILDLKAPAEAGVSLAPGIDLGAGAVPASLSDRIVNVRTPSVTVSGEIGTLARLYLDDGSGNVAGKTPLAQGWIAPSLTSTVNTVTLTVPESSKLGDGGYRLLVTLTDEAGNIKMVNGMAATGSIDFTVMAMDPADYDRIRPEARIVSQPTHAGYYVAGDVIRAEVAFDRAVYLVNGKNGSEFYVELSDGVRTRQAKYVSGLGGKLLTFEYEVVTGDQSSSGMTISAVTGLRDALEDIAGNQAPYKAVLQAPAVTQAIDAIAPSSPVVSLSPDVAAHAGVVSGQNATDGAFSVTAERAASVEITLSSMAGGVSNSVTKRIVASGGADLVPLSAADLERLGDAAVNVTAVAVDSAGNRSSASVPLGFTLDVHPPVVVAVSDNVPAEVTRDVINFTVTFSKPVQGAVGTDHFSAANGVVKSVTVDPGAAPNTQYIVTVQPVANLAQGTVSLTLNGSDGSVQLKDGAGNSVAGQNLQGLDAQKIDTQGPQVVSVAAPSADASMPNQPFDFVVKFSEMGSADVMGNIGPGNFTASNARVASVTAIDGSRTDYKVSVEPSVAQGQNDVKVVLGFRAKAEGAAGTAAPADALGNRSADQLDLSSLGGVQRVDTKPPTIAHVELVPPQAAGAGIYKAGDIVTAAVTFDETIKVTGKPALALTVGGTSRNAGFDKLSEDGRTLFFTYAIQAADNDAQGIAIAADQLNQGTASIADLAGNAADLHYAAVGNDPRFKVDTRAPVIDQVAITSATGGNGGLYKAGDVITASVTFSEAVVVAGKPTLDLTIGSAVRTADFASLAADGQTLAFTYTLTSNDNDPQGISIAAGKLVPHGGTIKDNAGNDALLSYPSVDHNGLFKVDTLAPSISKVSLAGAGGSAGIYNAGDIISVNVAFTEAVTVQGTPTLELTIGEAKRIARFAQSSADNRTLTFSYTITAADNDAAGISIAANKLNADAGTVADLAGNAAILNYPAYTSDPGFKVDNVAPVISAFSALSQTQPYIVGQQVELRAIASEALQSGSAVTVKLNIGAREVVLTRDASDATLLKGMFTVAAGEQTDALSVDSFTLGTGVAAPRDMAGNALTSTLVPAQNLSVGKAVAIDGIVPAAVKTFSLDAASDVGLDVHDGITSVNLPRFNFDGLTAGTTVKVVATVNGADQTLLSFVATASSESHLVPATLADAVYSNIRAVQVSPSGNVSASMLLGNVPTTGLLVISTAAPGVLGAPDFDGLQDRQSTVEFQNNQPGSQTRDYRTSIQTPRFNFTGGDEGNLAILFRDVNGDGIYNAATDIVLGSRLINAASAVDAAFGYSSTLVKAHFVDVTNVNALANGTYSDIKLVQMAAAGGLGLASQAAQAIQVFNNTPVPALTSVTTLEGSGLTNRTAMHLTVTGAKAGAQIAILADGPQGISGVRIGSGVAADDGSLSIDVSALNGAYANFRAQQQYAGKTSAATIVIDANSGTALGATTWDHVAPTLAIGAVDNTMRPAAGAATSIAFSFSEDPGASFGLSDVQVTGGSLSALQGSGLTRTATLTPDDAAVHSVSIAVAAGMYQDGAGNAGTASNTFVQLFNSAPVGGLAISGTTMKGNTLTVSSTIQDADGLPASGLQYQWQADGVDIVGATGNSLLLSSQDLVGKHITAKASYKDLGGTLESVTSQPTDAVADVYTRVTGDVTIGGTGDPQVGAVLVAHNTLTGTDGASLAGVVYKWFATDNGVTTQITDHVSSDPGASDNARLTLSSDLVGKVISVQASYVTASGTSEAVASSATTAVGWPQALQIGDLHFANTSGDTPGTLPTKSAQLLHGSGGLYILDINGDNRITGDDATTFVQELLTGGLTIAGTSLKASLISAKDFAGDAALALLSASAKVTADGKSVGSDFWTATRGDTSSDHLVWSSGGVYSSPDASYLNDPNRLHFNVLQVAVL